MAQYYTLEEAARVLGMDPEALKTKAQHRELRAYLDGGTWQFKASDIDELARKMGMGSDPDFSLSDLDLPSQPAGSESFEADLDLSEFQLGVARSDIGPASMDIPAVGSGSDADILLDDSILPLGSQSGSSSHIIGMETTGKLPSDSDVRLVPEGPKGASDSDVQLSGEVPVISGRPSDSDVTLVQEGSGSFDAIEAIDAGSDPSGETMLRPSPIGGTGFDEDFAVHTEPEDDSDFELTPSSVIDALQPDSGSDFELTALDGSDEFESTPRLRPSDSDVTGAEPAASGINLGRPSDSGINLQSVGGFSVDEADSIELAPLDDAVEAPPKAKPRPEPQSDPSATALPIKAESQKDIFDDTDFEVDALDLQNDDQTMQIDAQSDFDIDESESASEVFAIDEDDVDQNAATAMGPAVLEDEDAVGAAMEEDISGEMTGASGWDEEEAVEATPSRIAAAPGGGVLSSSAPGAEWGAFPVAMLAIASIFMLLLTFVTMDLVTNLNSFQGDVPVASGLVKMLAGLFGGSA